MNMKRKTIYEWTSEEKQLFQEALAELDPSSPDFYESVAYRIPWKSIDEVKEHYRELIGDARSRESDDVTDQIPTLNGEQDEVDNKTEGSPSPKVENVKEVDDTKVDSQLPEIAEVQRQKRRYKPWTKREHKLFLIGLDAFGRGNWRTISRNCVLTKTPAQVASHAQKFFSRQMATTPVHRRRPSINDTVSYFPPCPVQDEDSSSNGSVSVNSNLSFPPLNSAQNVWDKASSGHPHHSPGFTTQNHNLSHIDGGSIGPGLVSVTPQNGFPRSGNGVALGNLYADQGGAVVSVPRQNGFPSGGNGVATGNLYTDQGGVQNLGFHYNAGLYQSPNSSLISPQNVSPNIENQVLIFPQPHQPLSQSVSNSNLIFPQNVSPNIGKQVFSPQHLQPYPCFPENLFSVYSHHLVHPSFISSPQIGFPNVGVGKSTFTRHDPHQGVVQMLHSNHNGSVSSLNQSVHSSLIFPPKNAFPNIGNEFSFSQPHPSHVFPQNLNSVYNPDFVDPTLIPHPQSSSLGVVGNESAFALHKLHQGEVQNLESLPVDSSLISLPQSGFPNTSGSLPLFNS